MEWIDSRVQKPKSNSYERYVVVMGYDQGLTSVGFASWRPVNSYTDGEWEKITTTTGNELSDAKVLYWMPHPKKPKLLIEFK